MIIYDSTNPDDIPTTAEAVAGYVDGIYAWSDSGWLRFPNAAKISIAVSPSSQADALDVETGDATPAQAPGWVKAQIARGIKPWVYCNRSNRSAVESACQSAGIGTDQMALWVATLDGTQTVPAGYYPVAAVQYANSAISGGHYDLSITTAYGDVSAVITGVTDLTAEQEALLQTAATYANIACKFIEGEVVDTGSGPVPNVLTQILSAVNALKTELDTLKTQVAALPAPSVTIPTQISLTGELHS